MKAGMDFVVTKPFRIPEIMEKMKFWIGKAGRGGRKT
jgi:hypothetical protein